MPYQLNNARSKRSSRKVVNVHQNKFPKAYISTIDNSRRPLDSLSDMTNMELVQDNVPRPRPPLVRYGTQPAYPVVGRGEYRYGGERYVLWMLNESGTGKIYRQKDGGALEYLDDADNAYDITKWTKFTQSMDKVYPFNGVDKLSYIDLTDDSVHKFSALATPTITSVTYTGTAGAATHYYRITASNDVGESTASAVSSDNAAKDRDSWTENTDYITVVWPKVEGAVSYTIYYGKDADNCMELYSVSADQTTFVDYGTLNVNIFKLAPEGNSTEGFVAKWLYNDSKNSQLFGIDSTNKLYYSNPGTNDFSPYNGGGYATIDEGGDTQLNYVDGFRNGKGDPVITCSSRGAAGKGQLTHVTFSTITVGDQAIIYPNIYPASGQSGTYAPRATIKAGDALYYFTGQDVKSTGTSQNIVNILTTSSIAQVIEPDLEAINLDALENAVGVEYKDKLYWALPVGSTTNNEIWYLDRSRKNAWVLRWTVAARDLWLYEDNDGATHFCALVGDTVLEFSRAGNQTHHDDNTPFRSRVAFSALVWDEDGITLGSIKQQYFKFLQPKGQIQASATGLNRKGVQQSVGSDTFLVTTTFTGIGQWDYSGDYMYGDDPGEIGSFGKSVSVLELRPKGLINQLSWEVTANTTGTDYTLSSVSTRGWSSDKLIYKA